MARKIVNMFNRPRSNAQFSEGQQSKGILDDYAVRGDIATKEGTIEHTPTEAKHIVNKEYVDAQFPVTHASTTGQTTDDHHAETHTIVSHDTTATGAELTSLTDNSIANTLHRHSELVASDGAPDPALSVDATGQVGIGTGSPGATLEVADGHISVTDEFGYNWGASRSVSIRGNATTDYMKFNTDSLERMRIISGGNVGINTDTPDTKLQVVGTTKLGDDNTNFASFAGDGELTLTGTARVKKHIHLPVNSFTLGSTAPTAAVIGHFAVFQFSNVTTQTAVSTFHIPNDWDTTTDMTIHIHWAPVDANAGDVVWDIDYKSVKSENDEIITGTQRSLTVTDSTQTRQDELLKTTELTIPAGDLQVNDALGICISRDTDDENDTYGSAASLVLIEIEYTANSLGEAT